MNHFQLRALGLAGCLLTTGVGPVAGDVTVTVERHSAETALPEFAFQRVPGAVKNDAAEHATFEVLEGRRDGNGGEVVKLHDGFLPTEADEPAENFFFAVNSAGGRLLVD